MLPTANIRRARPIMTRLAIALAASTVLALPVFAQDAVSLLKAIQADVEASGGTMTFGELAADGSDGATASKVEIIHSAKGDKVLISRLVLSGAEVDDARTYFFKTLDATGVELMSGRSGGDSGTVKIDEISANAITVRPDEGENDPLLLFGLGSARFDDIHVIGQGEANVALNIPGATLDDLTHERNKRFVLGRLEVEAGSGSFAGKDDSSGSFALGAIRVRDLEMVGNGLSLGFAEFGRFSLEGSDNKARTISLNFDGLEVNNLYTPDFSLADKPYFPDQDMRMKTGGASFILDGQQVFTFKGSEAVTRFGADGVSQNARFSVSDFHVDLEAIAEAEGKEKDIRGLTDLGYDSLSISLDGEMDWNVETGVVTLSQMRYGADQMATLDLSFKLLGLDKEVAANLQNISARMREADNSAMQQAMMFQTVAELSALSIEEISITLDDDSLTRRLMKMQAEKSGQEAGDLVAAVPFMAGAMMAPLEAPDFTAMVAAALGTYLQSALAEDAQITMTAKPDEPVSFAELVGLSAGLQTGNIKPAEIIERLNITVSAQ